MLWSLGYRDCWREANPHSREVTWRGHDGSEGRIDGAWASPALRARVRHAGTTTPVKSGLSDHSAVVVDVTRHGPVRQDSARAGAF